MSSLQIVERVVEVPVEKVVPKEVIKVIEKIVEVPVTRVLKTQKITAVERVSVAPAFTTHLWIPVQTQGH